MGRDREKQFLGFFFNVPVRDDFSGERIKEARRGDSRGGKGPREIGELLLLEVAQPAVGDHLRIKMRRTACGRWGTCVWKHTVA